MTDERINKFLSSIDKLIEQVNNRITDDLSLDDLFKFDREILEIKSIYDSVLQTQILEEKIDISNLKKNVEELLNNFSLKVNEFDTSKETFEHTFNLIKTNLEELKINLETSVSSKIDEVEQSKSTMKTTVDNKINEINQTKEDLTNSVNTKIGELETSVSSKIDELEQSKSTIENTVDNKITEINQTKEDLTSSVNTKIEELETSFNDKSKEIEETKDTLTKTVDDKIFEVNQTKEELTNSVNTKIVEFETSLNNKSEEIEETKNSLISNVSSLVDDLTLKIDNGYFKGDKGEPLTFDDLTEEQKQELISIPQNISYDDLLNKPNIVKDLGYITSGDLNDMKKSFTALCHADVLNLPFKDFYSVMGFGNEENIVSQIAIQYVTADTYVRSFYNTWSSWKKLG